MPTITLNRAQCVLIAAVLRGDAYTERQAVFATRDKARSAKDHSDLDQRLRNAAALDALADQFSRAAGL